MNGKILIIDDDKEMRTSLEHLITQAGFDTTTAQNGREGLQLLQSFNPDAVLCDVRMPQMDGLEFQKKAQEMLPVPVVLISAHGDIQMAVDAVQNGAYSFVEKPFDPRRLLGILNNATKMKQLLDQSNRLQDRLAELVDLEKILLGTSDQMKSVRAMIVDFATSSAPVLIKGDTGTGKELVARALHDLGPNNTAPFVAVNCAVIPADRFEDTVFGTEDRPNGLLIQAHGGTLFLDELSSLPFETQSKMLRVIETKQFQRLGAMNSQNVDFRVISASSHTIEDQVDQGIFRRDLLFRLNALVISLPKLADRGGDILLLFQHYSSRFGQIYDINVPPLTAEDMSVLLTHDWRGNVRELQGVAERRVLAIRRSNPSVKSALFATGNEGQFPSTLREALATFERELIGNALKHHEGRMDDAANSLGIGRRTLNEKIVKLGLDKQAILDGS